jgi:hypothetical protein
MLARAAGSSLDLPGRGSAVSFRSSDPKRPELPRQEVPDIARPGWQPTIVRWAGCVRSAHHASSRSASRLRRSSWRSVRIAGRSPRSIGRRVPSHDRSLQAAKGTTPISPRPTPADVAVHVPERGPRRVDPIDQTGAQATHRSYAGPPPRAVRYLSLDRLDNTRCAYRRSLQLRYGDRG